MQLEQKVKQAIPGTDLRAEPMISSKYSSWKKTFKDIQEVLHASGFGWNSTTKTVLAHPSSMWDDFIMAHPGLAYIREKLFRFYETWVEIYGRDTANGAGAMDFRGAAMNPPPPPPAGTPQNVNNHQASNDNEGDQESTATPNYTYDDSGA